MDRDNQRPNPVEDYMRKVIDEDRSSSSGKIKVPRKKRANNKNNRKKRRLEKMEELAKNPTAKKAFQERSHLFDPTGHLEEIGDSEVEVADVRRHPFGLALIYAQFIIASILALGLLLFLTPSTLGAGSVASLLVGLLVLVMAIFGIIFLALATKVYRGNQLIITDLNVTEVQQIGLFNRRISELSMANVEDVTADTRGLFATVFNYGTLTIETAGEEHHFIFRNCPYPNAYAKMIQDTRAEYLQKYGGRTH